MTSKERIRSCWNGIQPDHVPLATWCFGVKPAPEFVWTKDGVTVKHWYSMRMEHIHLLPEPWDLSDDFRRVLAWKSLGVDDILDVSVPWSIDPAVSWTDTVIPAGQEDDHPVLVRKYTTPSGILRHAVRKTGEDPGEGWVIQPEYVPLIEDYNIPRGVEHAVSTLSDVPVIAHLYRAPDSTARAWFHNRMAEIRPFAEEHGIAVQAWSAFGMDCIIWLTGVEGAVLMAVDDPVAFGRLADIIAEADYGRTELACSHPAVDLIVQRGWYSSTDFWSPGLFDQFMLPHITELAGLAHRNGKKFGYTMTTGVETLGRRLVEAGVDVLYFIDPVQDTISLETARDLLGGDMTLVGGINAVNLAVHNDAEVRDEVRRALDVLGPTNRFILQPVDALFPDTPWKRVETMIETWERYR